MAGQLVRVHVKAEPARYQVPRVGAQAGSLARVREQPGDGFAQCDDVPRRHGHARYAILHDVALTFGARGGVYIAGGIAPRVLPYLQRGGFREAFERKGRLTPLVARLPAFVVTHPQLGLLGAATIAAGL